MPTGTNEPPMDDSAESHIDKEGAPKPFPFAAPLPGVYLRPMQQPIYDTEVLPKKNTPYELRFMQRQLGQNTLHGDYVKTIAFTNLVQPAQLSNPLEFSLFGFQLYVFDKHGEIVDRRERGRVFGQAAFTFTYTGNRIYLQVPAYLIPADQVPDIAEFMRPVLPTGLVKELHDQTNPKTPEEIRQEEAKRAMYKFTVGRSALRIRPTESFSFNIEWPYGAPQLHDDVRIALVMRGLMWTPM